jgi:hypothetical protein
MAQAAGGLVVRRARGGLRKMTDQKSDEPDWRSVVVRDEARRAHDRADSFFEQVNEAAIKNGESAFRACLLINGGAAVSVLAFIGSLASKDVIGVSQLASVADSLILFALGVVAAVVGMALSYVVNYLTAAGRLRPSISGSIRGLCRVSARFGLRD